MHGDHVIELLLGHFSQRCIARDTGVIDHDVHTAELLYRRGDEVIDLRCGGDIAGNCPGDLGSTECLGRGPGVVDIQITQQDPSAFGDELLGDREAETLGTTGDDRDPSGQQCHSTTLLLTPRTHPRASSYLIGT